MDSRGLAVESESAGQLLETFVIMEMRKQIQADSGRNSAIERPIFRHYRSRYEAATKTGLLNVELQRREIFDETKPNQNQSQSGPSHRKPTTWTESGDIRGLTPICIRNLGNG